MATASQHPDRNARYTPVESRWWIVLLRVTNGTRCAVEMRMKRFSERARIAIAKGLLMGKGAPSAANLLWLCSSEPQVLAGQLVDRTAAHQLHVAFDFGVQVAKRFFDAGLTCGREGIQIKSTSRARFRAH